MDFSLLVSAGQAETSHCQSDCVDANYPHRYMNNSLVDGNLQWLDGTRARIADAAGFFKTSGNEIVYGARMDDARPKQWTMKSEDAANVIVRASLSARDGNGPVKVDKIRICVDAFQALPKFDAEGESELGGLVAGRFYYVKVSPPPTGRRECFEASYYPDPGDDDGSIVTLKPGTPDIIDVKIDATEPGYYMLAGDIFLSRGTELQRFGLSNFIHTIYFK
jgi:hypothetical protein